MVSMLLRCLCVVWVDAVEQVELHNYSNIEFSTRLLHAYTPYISYFIYLYLCYLFYLHYLCYFITEFTFYILHPNVLQ